MVKGETPMEKVYMVTESELRGLYESRERFTALAYGGVDNWEHYREAIRDYLNDNGVDDFDQLVDSDLKDLPYERENS